MAENSPIKQARAYHPYGRVKSPLKASQQQALPLVVASTSMCLSNKMTENYFSFSGGSSSLFPAGSGCAQTITNGISKVKHQHVTKNTSLLESKKNITSTCSSTKNKLDSVGTITLKTNTNTGKIMSVGAVGSRRPLGPVTAGKPLTGSGFIPVQRSFTIWGDTDSNSNSMEFSDEVVPKDNEVNDENKPTDPVESLTLEEIHRSKTVRKNLFQLGETENQKNIEVDKESKGILTERNSDCDHAEYILDIYKYCLGYEKRVPLKPRYMEKQEDITHNMRSILVDWLVEVGQEYDFDEGTLFQAVGFMDRFLGRMAVSRNKLQLVGTTAMYIAAKFQETDAPGISDVVYITDETYTKEQVLIMEGIMLRTLQFDLMVPTACDFIRALSTLLNLNSHVTSLALYIAELSLVEGERYLRYKSSLIATSAIALARFSHNMSFWDPQLEMFSQLTYAEVRRVGADLLNSFYEAPCGELTAIYEKYKSVRLNCASYSILPPALPMP